MGRFFFLKNADTVLKRGEGGLDLFNLAYMFLFIDLISVFKLLQGFHCFYRLHNKEVVM